MGFAFSIRCHFFPLSLYLSLLHSMHRHKHIPILVQSVFFLSLLLFICRAFRFQTHTHQLDTYGVFLIKHLIAIAATTCTNFKTGQFPIQIGFLPFCTAYTTYMATWVAYSIWTPMHFGRGEKKKPNVRCWMFCVCVYVCTRVNACTAECGDRMSRNIHFIGEVAFFLSLSGFVFSISFGFQTDGFMCMFNHCFLWLQQALHCTVAVVAFALFYFFRFYFVHSAHTVAWWLCESVHTGTFKRLTGWLVGCLCCQCIGIFFYSSHTAFYMIRARQTPSHHRQMELNEK